MYKNYGDVNFFDTGILIKETGIEHEYEVITCNYDSDMENHYFIQSGIINIDDVDKKEIHDVCSWASDRDLSIDYTDEEYERLAVDCFLYGISCFDYKGKWMTKNEVIDWIDREYIDEIEWEFYKSNFYESNRNVVVKIYNNHGQSSRQIYNSLEDALEDFEIEAEKGYSIEIEDM